jgi:hypothetical protein
MLPCDQGWPLTVRWWCAYTAKRSLEGTIHAPSSSGTFSCEDFKVSKGYKKFDCQKAVAAVESLQVCL